MGHIARCFEHHSTPTTGRGYRCRFQSPLAFEPYKPLFDQELKLLEGKGADEEWFAAGAPSGLSRDEAGT